MPRFLTYVVVLLLTLSMHVAAQQAPPEQGAASDQTANQLENEIENLQEPLYSPFIERYVLDELKQLRTDMAAQRVDLLQQIVDRQMASADRGVTYATNVVTYFFYLIAGVSSILVLVGWTSIREMKERVHSLADEQISKLVTEYEQRLHLIEKQLNQKTQHIEENREEIELTREVQALWLRAAQENNPANKIVVYDQILKLRRGDGEALSYKADAVLELGEPQWAANLCLQALEADAENSHAYYQLACAYTAMNQFDEAVRYLSEVLSRTDTYREEIINDPALEPLHSFDKFKELVNLDHS